MEILRLFHGAVFLGFSFVGAVYAADVKTVYYSEIINALYRLEASDVNTGYEEKEFEQCTNEEIAELAARPWQENAVIIVRSFPKSDSLALLFAEDEKKGRVYFLDSGHENGKMVDMLYYKQADTPEDFSVLIRCFLVSKT